MKFGDSGGTPPHMIWDDRPTESVIGVYGRNGKFMQFEGSREVAEALAQITDLPLDIITIDLNREGATS